MLNVSRSNKPELVISPDYLGIFQGYMLLIMIYYFGVGACDLHVIIYLHRCLDSAYKYMFIFASGRNLHSTTHWFTRK